MTKAIKTICAGLLLTLSAGVCLAAEKALVFAWNDGGATVAALREAGMDAVQAPRLPLAGPLALEDARLVVITADAAVPDDLAVKIAAFVRSGGGLLTVHTSADNPNYWWETYRRVGKGEPRPSPLWDAMPFVSVPLCDQNEQGLRNPFGPTRALRQAQSPLLAGVDLTQGPNFPYHGFMVLPTHPIVQGAHQMFGWSEDQYKSPLWGNGQVLAWGDDPEQRPLLLSAEYGAGRCVAAAVPLFDKTFMQWPGSRVLVKNLATWLVGSRESAAPTVAAENKIYGIGLPWMVRDSLRRMGLTITAIPEGTSGAIVYGQPTVDQARAIAQLARANKPVVLANPNALRVAPLSELVAVSAAPAPAAAPPAAAPRMVVNNKILWRDATMLVGAGWAQDPENEGEAKGWFTAPGAAAVKWQDADVMRQEVTSGKEPRVHAKKSEAQQSRAETKKQEPGTAIEAVLQGPPASGAPAQLAWSRSYRWRLEGNLLDGRDLIEGWEKPSFDDSAWAQQAMGQQPPPPKVAGATPPAQNLMAGAVWARAKMTLSHVEGSRGWLAPSSDLKFVTLLDGKPLRQPVAVRTLAAGEHMVALRAWPLARGGGNVSDDPWGDSSDKLRWPTIIDFPWVHHTAEKGEADGFFAGYHADWLSGDPTHTQLPEGGPGWYQVRLDARHDRMPLQIADAPESRTDTMVWLDGQRLGAAPQMIDLPKLSPGAHLLTLLKANAGELAITPRANLWYKATVRLPAVASWNAIQFEGASKALLYVNGHQVTGEMRGMIRVPWKSGDNLVVLGNLERQVLPSLWLAQAPTEAAIVNVPAAQRLSGVWYRREDPEHQGLAQAWPGALSGATPPQEWSATAPDSEAGIIATVGDERPRWFAAPFQVSEREAAGPARLIIDTTGDDVPADVIKDVWVNGQRVPARIEFASTQRYELGRGKQTLITFVLSGKLKAGTNWLTFPLDFQEYYRMRVATISEDGRWPVPLPKLDFSGNLDALAWSESLGRLSSEGLVHRGQVISLPAGATVLARFSDGVPAAARVGSISFATTDQSRDWSRWIEEDYRFEWAVTKTGDWHYGYPMQLHHRNHGSGDPVQADGAQIAASLLRGTPVIQGAQGAEGGGATVLLAAASEPRLLNYQLRNWTGMVMSEGRLAVPAGATRVVVPAPAQEPSPMTTALRGDRWLRAALLEDGGASVRDYLESKVNVPRAVAVLLSPTDGSQRDLPATIPGSPSYDPFNRNWSLAAQSPGNPVVVPGERIELRAMCRNMTDKPQQVALELNWEGSLDSKPVALRGLHFTLAPHEQRTELLPCGFRVSDMHFVALPGEDAAPLRAMAAEQQPEGALASGRVVARGGDAVVSELALVAVRPWKEFASNATHRLPGQDGAPGGFGMEQFQRTGSLETLSDPKSGWWSQQTGGNWCSALDWCRDHFVLTGGTGGGFGGFQGKKDFAWGPCDTDDVYKGHGLAIDNASYLPDGTQYQEFLYASLSREYNRFTRGTQPLQMAIADYWGNFGMPARERNVAEFLRWRRAQGRPLNLFDADQLKALRENDPALKQDWQRFADQARVAWCQQYMAGMPPKSINYSQGEAVKFLFSRAHETLEAIRAVLNAANSCMFQPLDIGWRGELHFGWMRAMNPNLLVRNDSWNQSTGHSQSFGSSGHAILATPEWGRILALDNGLMAIRDDAGRIEPLINTPINDELLPKNGRIRLLGEGKSGHGSLPAELLGRDFAFHLCSVIQPERVLGYYVVPPLERMVKDKLDGSAGQFGARPDRQPILSLASMLRNYGALWGGVIAPDRLDKLKPGEGALYLMPSGVGDAEAKSLVDLVQRGGATSVFFSTGGTKTHETPLSDLFGVKYAPLAAGVRGGMLLPGQTERPFSLFGDNPPQYVATRAGKDEIQGSGGLSGRALLRQTEAGKGRAIFSALNCNENWGWDHDLARQLTKSVNWASGNPVTLPDGVGGYAFEAKGLTFLVLEDLKYTGGEAAIHVKLPAGKYLAAELFTGQPVKVDAQTDGAILHPMLLPNGGSVVVVRKIEP